MVTLTEPAKMRCCATDLEPEIQWAWMPEDILFKQDELLILCTSPSVPFCIAVLLREKKKREGKIFSCLVLITCSTLPRVLYSIQM